MMADDLELAAIRTCPHCLNPTDQTVHVHELVLRCATHPVAGVTVTWCGGRLIIMCATCSHLVAMVAVERRRMPDWELEERLARPTRAKLPVSAGEQKAAVRAEELYFRKETK